MKGLIQVSKDRVDPMLPLQTDRLLINSSMKTTGCLHPIQLLSPPPPQASGNDELPAGTTVNLPTDKTR